MMAEREIPIIDCDFESTWIWSDLHLGDETCREAWERPFPSVLAMNRHLLAEWRRCVRPTDTIICLGDVTVGPPVAAVDGALAALPGDKVLVVRNHEFVNNFPGAKDYGFEAAYPTVVCDSNPALLLTHEPLDTVPAGCVNVHGHLHGTHARSNARRSRRHLNVNVELVGYRPVHLTELAATARALLAGDVEPQKTTGKTMTLAARAAAAGTP